MEIDEIRRVRLDKVKNLEENQIDPYGKRFVRTHSISDVLENFEEGKEVHRNTHHSIPNTSRTT